ncbi:hypothetical protein [Nevskia sp.]|uniref:hypothetical protein n=1 Tax=Nevskia sp. TaxID=1929292 RepID=UPI003F720205
MTPAQAGLATLALLLVSGAALADRPRERGRPVPLPQAPSSLPPPPWAAYGLPSYGWPAAGSGYGPALGLVIVDPRSPPVGGFGSRPPDTAREPYRDSAPYRDDDPPPVPW